MRNLLLQDSLIYYTFTLYSTFHFCVKICINSLSYYISRIQGYLLVKIALRFLSRIPKIYVDPRSIAQGVPP